ncbi:uncharacterized protein LOC111614715 [Centruroides sculpturatus]|uniref:uncharacterized protein LOC111614715 n=1 Tax=Centruroides sculpturatus TaxID=218467 RepID=UPI000C6CAA6C|nr:uncharacterized protein LOC111614715 [Centruroides sculpturatus]
MAELTVLVPLHPPHGCQLCLPIPRDYADHAGLVKHLKHIHGTTLRFECRACGYTHDKLKAIKAHQLKTDDCRLRIEACSPPPPLPADRKKVCIPTRPRKPYQRRKRRSTDNTPTSQGRPTTSQQTQRPTRRSTRPNNSTQPSNLIDCRVSITPISEPPATLSTAQESQPPPETPSPPPTLRRCRRRHRPSTPTDQPPSPASSCPSPPTAVPPPVSPATTPTICQPPPLTPSPTCQDNQETTDPPGAIPIPSTAPAETLPAPTQTDSQPHPSWVNAWCSRFAAAIDEDMLDAMTDDLVALAHKICDVTPYQPARRERLSHDITDDARQIQRLYRTNRTKAVSIITEGQPLYCRIDSTQIQQHFTNVYASTPHTCGPFPSFLPTAYKPPDCNPLVSPFTPDEVSNRLRRCHNTAPGPDGLRYHHWLHTNPSGAILCSTFNAALRLLYIPLNWRCSNTILIHKKGDQNIIDNWRPIALSNTLGKTFSACLASRFLTWCTVNEIFSGAQKGFLRHEGCLDHSFLLQTITQDARRKLRNCHIAWLDLANAFGSVPHSTILACLNWCGLHHDSIAIIEELLRHNYTNIRTHEGLTESIPINSGVRQGCPLSPLLFNVVIETAIRSVKDLQLGYKLYDEEIGILAYADDLVLISSTADGLQQQLNRISDWAKWAGLSFKPGKCATLSILGDKRTTGNNIFTLDGHPIDHLQRDGSYNYLGIPTGFSNHNTDDNVVTNLMDNITKLDRAKLAPWQKFDAMNSILLPKLTYHLLLGTNPKKRLHALDKHIKKCAKRWLYLPQRASNEIIHLPYDRGGTNITPCSELADICQLTHAAHLFDSRDPTVTAIALGSLRSVVRHRIRRTPTDEDIRAYLDGSMEGDLGLPSKDITSIWTRLRAATRRLRKIINVSWQFTGTTFILTTNDNQIPRQACTKVLTAMVKSALLHHLLQKPDQGKAFQLIAGHPTSNHFLRDGLYTSFADWRFVHRARLSVVPLHGLRRFGTRSKKCRQCSHPNETLAHVLNHCGPNLRLVTQRHNSILNRLRNAINDRGLKILCNQQVPGFDDRCRPDLVTICDRTKTATIVDVAVPFENGRNAFDVARNTKVSKYYALTQHLRQQGYDTYCDAFILGSLGGFDPANIAVIQRLGIS